MILKNNNKISGVSIIGGTGFIGKHLVKFFSDNFDGSIRILSRSKGSLNGISFIQGDLSVSNSLNELVKNQDLVINLAYISENYDANILAIDNLINACISEGVSKFIHCSTAVVAGRVNIDTINEDTICKPLNEYEQTKLAIEEYLLDRCKDKVELIIVRPTAVFGEGGLNLVKLSNSLLNKPWIVNMFLSFINGKRQMHLVPVEEVVSCIYYLAMINNDLSGEKFIISQDVSQNNNFFDVINKLALHFDQKMYPAIFFPFSSLALSILLKLNGRSQVNPKQVFSSKKIHDYGYKSNIDFNVSLEKFAKSIHIKE